MPGPTGSLVGPKGDNELLSNTLPTLPTLPHETPPKRCSIPLEDKEGQTAVRATEVKTVVVVVGKPEEDGEEEEGIGDVTNASNGTEKSGLLSLAKTLTPGTCQLGFSAVVVPQARFSVSGSTPRLSLPPSAWSNGVKLHPRNLRILRRPSGLQRTDLSNPVTLSVLDLAATDLDLVKKSFVAHAHAFSRGDLDEVYKLARNVAREIRHSERQQQRRRHVQRQSFRQKAMDSRRSSLSNASDVDGTVFNNSLTSFADFSASCAESAAHLQETPSQKVQFFRFWLYDRLVRQYLTECSDPVHAPKRGERVDVSGIFAKVFSGNGVRSTMMGILNPSTPLHLHELDIFDELAAILGERDMSPTLSQSGIAEKDLQLPLPVFVYIFSRALFRLHYLSAFPRNSFTKLHRCFSLTRGQKTNSDGPSASQKATSTKPNGIDANVAGGGGCSETLIRDAMLLLEECQRVSLQFFERVDTNQKGMITWFSFTDSLMEQVEVQLRVMQDKENSEDTMHAGAKVFDNFTPEPFPSMLLRLGYVGAVTEVRHNESTVIIEGVHDFALCNSSHGSMIQSKLLVRTADVLFLHREGAQEDWNADRWDAAIEVAAVSEQKQKFKGKILRYENTRSRDNRYTHDVLGSLQRNSECDANNDDDDPRDKVGGDRVDLRPKPLIESALEVHGLGPHLPTSIVTLHNDLLIRFFSMEQHISVVPETLIIGSVETITAMDWCDTGADGDASLKLFLFLGTRTGIVYRVDLQTILRRMACARNTSGDLITTGIAAAATIHEKLETHIVQQQTVHKDFVTSICLTAAGVLLSSSLDGMVVLSRADSLTMLRSFRVDRDAGVRFACITPLRNMIVTLSTKNCVSLWANTHHSIHVDLYDPMSAHYFPIVAVKVDESLKQLITLDSSGHGNVWNLRSSLLMSSFFAVSSECFSTFRHMYAADDATPRNGYRLFDVDGSDKKRPSMFNGSSNQRNMLGLLRTTLASIEAANKARQLHPVRHVAYDAFAKRLFVSGVRNNVMCTFTSTLKALKAHSAPLHYITACERNRWIISTSDADCRVWDYPTGKLARGLKASNPEFFMARVAPVFTAVSMQSKGAELTASTWDVNEHTLDACKQPISSVNDIIDIVRQRSDTFRRDGGSKIPSKQSAKVANGVISCHVVSREKSDAGETAASNEGARGISLESRQLRGETGASSLSQGNASSERGGLTMDSNTQENLGMPCRILCTHVDWQERFIFYAIHNGDIRMHSAESGRLAKTLLTTPPSTDLVLDAVLQYRHLFTSSRGSNERADCLLSEDEDGEAQMLSSAQLRVQDIAFVLHRLLNHKKKLPLQQQERFSIHMEAVGMMTLRGSQELGVIYADGIIRFFSITGNSVHAHRLIISEFLVMKALSYMKLDSAMQQRLLNTPRDSDYQCKDEEPHKQPANIIVEADVVSFVAVSMSLGIICLVQINGRVSLMDMSTPAGLVVQAFTLAGEISAVSFLGVYPCLVVGDAQGIISFFLVKGSTMLALLDDFYKAVTLFHRQHSRKLDPHVLDGKEHGADGGGVNSKSKKTCNNSAPRIWWFRSPGVPAVLHFDPVCCTLYVGTQQGYISSYLVRGLIAAFDLHPVFGGSAVGKSFESIVTSMRHQRDYNEQRVCNILLVFFGITPQRAMKHIETTHSAEHLSLPMGRIGTTPRSTSVSWKATEPPSTDVLQGRTTSSLTVASSIDSIHVVSPFSIWRNSLVWVYESCRPLFYSPCRFNQPDGGSAVMHPLFTLEVVTLSDLLIGTAVLHRVLQLLVLRCYNANSKWMKDGGTVDTTPLTASVLTYGHLMKLRQCVIDTIRCQNEHFCASDHVNWDFPHTFPDICIAEEMVDLDAVTSSFSGEPCTITSDWVELLFRRHVLNTVKNSPLALLSRNAIMERARCERLERVKILQLQRELQKADQKKPDQKKPKENLCVKLNSPDLKTQVSVDWDAFIEGAVPNLLTEALQKRNAKAREEELVASVDAESVRCITTRRSGIVFVGCADGSVSVWSQYACARIHEVCPSIMFDDAIRSLGESVKGQFLKQVKSAERQRQWRAYATGCYDTKVHETKMRNLNLKYKMVMIKDELELGVSTNSESGGMPYGANSVSERGNSGAMFTGGLDGGCEHAFPDHSFSSYDIAGLPLLEKQRDLLLAVLDMSLSKMMQKCILMEDLCFLPLRMSLLSVLDDFNADAYVLAADLAVARLKKEMSGTLEDSNDYCKAEGRNGNSAEDRVCRMDSEQQQQQRHPSQSQCVINQKFNWSGDTDEAVQDDEFAFLLLMHEKHLGDYLTQLREMCSSIPYKSAKDSLDDGMKHSEPTRISMVAKRRTSVFSRTTAETSHSNTMAWLPTCARSLPHYARIGLEGNSNAIRVSAFSKTGLQLRRCVIPELDCISAESQWITTDKAIACIVRESDGTLSPEIFNGLIKSLSRWAARSVRDGLLPETSSVGMRDASKGCHGLKPTPGLMEPFLLSSAQIESAEMYDPVSMGRCNESPFSFLSDYQTNMRVHPASPSLRNVEEIGKKEKRESNFFVTETDATRSQSPGSQNMGEGLGWSPTCTTGLRGSMHGASINVEGSGVPGGGTEMDNDATTTPTQINLVQRRNPYRARFSRIGVTRVLNLCQGQNRLCNATPAGNDSGILSSLQRKRGVAGDQPH